MILFILLGVTALISVIVWLCTRGYNYSFEWVWSLIIGVVLSVIISAIGGASSVTHDPKNFAGKTSSFQTLSALKDGKEVSGSFFLLSGGFGSEAKYSYIVVDEDGVSRVQSIAIERAGVKEDGKRTLETVTKTYKSNFWFPGMWSDKTDYVFHIPQGSMTSEFAVDME